MGHFRVTFFLCENEPESQSHESEFRLQIHTRATPTSQVLHESFWNRHKVTREWPIVTRLVTHSQISLLLLDEFKVVEDER